MLDFRPAKNMY